MRLILKKPATIPGFSLPGLLVVLVIIGILVLVALPNLMPLISRAKATEAQQQLTFLHSLEQSYFYSYSRYSDDLMELGFEQAQLVIEGGMLTIGLKSYLPTRRDSKRKLYLWSTSTRMEFSMSGR